MKKITTKSEIETFDFAKNFAKNLKGGEVIGLIGDLGAGKTVFVKGLASGLGIKENVNSPTFALMKVYKIKNSKTRIKNLVHIDTYRTKNPEDVTAIGAFDYFSRDDTITVVEWADKIKKELKKSKATIFEFLSAKNNRRTIIKN
jgi:tRNA threonylcarbamoyladenosine biosynthesis protein TsaE